jgi:dihydroxy-acid dehydratase
VPLNRGQRLPLRSSAWTSAPDEIGLEHRAALRVLGVSSQSLKAGAPLIGIFCAGGRANPCDLLSEELVRQVQAGVLDLGSASLVFGTLPLSEDLVKPTAMLYRNLLAMETEELLRAYPVDGVVLIGGCDKTLPGMLMGAGSARLPTVALSPGYRTPGCFRGEQVGAGTDLWRLLEERRAGKLSDSEWAALEEALAAAGTCNVMGTASTMAVLCEVLGISPIGANALAAGSAAASLAARQVGSRVVDMVRENLSIEQILTAGAFADALAVLSAIGGSTNAIIHLTAIAGRLGIPLTLQHVREVSRQVPQLCDLAPAGRFRMADYTAAGGTATVLTELQPHLDLSRPVAFDRSTLARRGEAGGPIRPYTEPVRPTGGVTAVWGTLAPEGAVVKTSTASPQLLRHTGRAVVFRGYTDLRDRIDDASLDVEEDSILVLTGIGPRAVPGMPEWGEIPIPAKLLRRGVTDLVRISDGRMSGTSYGTVVLHVAPEAAAGGPLGLVRDGDEISLDVAAGRLNLHVPDNVLSARAADVPPPPEPTRGWPALYTRHVLQAPQGCDLDFLVPNGPEDLARREPVIGRS